MELKFDKNNLPICISCLEENAATERKRIAEMKS